MARVLEIDVEFLFNFVVVGKSLLSEVFRPDRDFFLEVYAPWCIHCHSLQPQVSELAQAFLDVGAQELIGVGRLNGQSNDSPR